MEEGQPVCGGVVFLHTEKNGKHFYEVTEFLNQNRGMFTRRGDELVMINSTNVEDLTPNAFAQCLADGPSKLITHHPCKKSKVDCGAMEIRVENKELTSLEFNLVMVREEDLDHCVDEDSPPEDLAIEDDCLSDDTMLLISMDDTQVSVVTSRGSDTCQACEISGGSSCQFSEVIFSPSRAEICLSTAQKISQVKARNLFMKNVLVQKYVTPWRNRLLLEETMSATITIYSYTSNKLEISNSPGSPVLLNITGTENFFCCSSKDGDEKRILQIVTHNKSDLKTICADDEDKWSLVFFMTSGPTDLRRFESALHRGWFIYTKSESCEVDVGKCSDPSQRSTFFVLIQS